MIDCFDDRREEANYYRQQAAGMHHDVTVRIWGRDGEETITVNIPGQDHDDEDLEQAITDAVGYQVRDWREL